MRTTSDSLLAIWERSPGRGDQTWTKLATTEREFIWPTVEESLKELLPGTEVHVDTGGDHQEQWVEGNSPLGGYFSREVRFQLQWCQNRLWWSVWETGAEEESRTA
jgi:hypothetical protein